MPENVAKGTFELGKVIRRGDCVTKDEKGEDKQKPVFVEEGDTILFQIPARVRESSMYNIGGTKVCLIHQEDIIAILKTNKARAIRFSTLDAICRALNCQPGDLLEYEREDQPDH